MITTPRRRTRRSIRAPPDGPNFRAVSRNSPVVVPENFGAPRSGPEIPECSSLRIYSRIPRSLLVIRPVIAWPGGILGGSALLHENAGGRSLRPDRQSDGRLLSG